MSYINSSEMWDWRCQIYDDDSTSRAEASHHSLLNEVNQNVDHISYMFDHEVTPVKACSLPRYASNSAHATETRGGESELYRDHSSQVKRRRMLQFESQVLETPLCNDEEFLRSKEMQEDCFDMSQWVAGFTDIDSASPSSNECSDPSSEPQGWITGCFNVAENEMHLCDQDLFIDAAPSSRPVYLHISDDAELRNTGAPEYEANLVMNTLKTHHNVAFRGTKSYIRSTSPKVASTVVYPFAFIKPCGILGDTTLKDINRRIHNPRRPPPKAIEDEDSYPTSPFSGKPVVGKTKIQTQGGKGKGSITIMQTKG